MNGRRLGKQGIPILHDIYLDLKPHPGILGFRKLLLLVGVFWDFRKYDEGVFWDFRKYVLRCKSWFASPIGWSPGRFVLRF